LQSLSIESDFSILKLPFTELAFIFKLWLFLVFLSKSSKPFWLRSFLQFSSLVLSASMESQPKIIKRQKRSKEIHLRFKKFPSNEFSIVILACLAFKCFAFL